MRLRNYFPICLALCLFTPTVDAQSTTLHIVYNINGNTTDEIHKGCSLDRTNAHDLFYMVGQVAQESGIPLKVKEYDARFNVEGAVAQINGLEVSPNDGIIFIFSGHGVLKDKTRRWPQLVYTPEAQMSGGVNDLASLALKDVHEAIVNTGARMSLTLGSACSEDLTGKVDVNQLLLEMKEHQNTNEQSKTLSNNFGIFTEYEGHIISSGASPGQFAYVNEEVGSHFINVLLNTIIDGLIAESPTSWGSIFKKTKENVAHLQKNKQVPQFMIVKSNRQMYSGDINEHYSDDDPDMALTYISQDEYNLEWEQEYEREEAIELLPYLLIDALFQKVSSEDTNNFDRQAERMYAFYNDEILANYYFGFDPGSGLHKIYCDQAIEDYADASIFGSYLGDASRLYPVLLPEVKQRVEAFIASLN